MTLTERFESNCIPEPMSGCWLWLGAVGNRGYGVFRMSGNPRDPVTGAHRASHRLYKGEIPAGQVVRHRCDVPTCVNPDHLRLGSQAENIMDAARAGRMHRFTPSRRPYATLTPALAAEIRASSETGRDLARKFGVSTATISRIKRSHIWKEVQP